MTFEKLQQLLKTSTAIKLITADNAPLIISFLYKSFKQNNVITIAERELVSLLSDHLYLVNKDETRYPNKPKEYLTEWANAGFLRKYFETDDEPIFELTPATENALKWIEDLEKPEFIGTDSRLKILFGILKELSSKTRKDNQSRIRELEDEKRRIEEAIENAKNNRFEVLDDRQIKEYFFNAQETAKKLLADFRQVEQNFRDLDRDFRRKIITTTQVKGKVLEELFEQQDYLKETDQGKSFTAFWEFLLSQSKQLEFEKLIDDVLSIPVIRQLQKENFNIGNIRNNLVEAGDKTNKTTGSLLEQLRKYLEHKSFFENKRIHDHISEILKTISQNADKDFSKLPLIEIDETIHIDLVLNRPLFSPPQKIEFSNSNPEEGRATSGDSLLYEQFEINTAELKSNIKKALKSRSQISFVDFVKEYEINRGVAEVIAYMDIASRESSRHVIDENNQEYIDVKNSRTKKSFRVKVPQIIFCR